MPSQQLAHHQSAQSLSDGTPLMVPNQSQADLNVPGALQSSVQPEAAPQVIVSFPQAFFARGHQPTSVGVAASGEFHPDRLGAQLIEGDAYQDPNDGSALAAPLQT